MAKTSVVNNGNRSTGFRTLTWAIEGMSGQKQHRCGDAVGASSEEEEKTNFYKCLSFSRARKSSSDGMTHISNCSSSCCCHAALFLYIYTTLQQNVYTHMMFRPEIDTERTADGPLSRGSIFIPIRSKERFLCGKKRESSIRVYTYYVVVVLTPVLFCALCCRWIELWGENCGGGGVEKRDYGFASDTFCAAFGALAAVLVATGGGGRVPQGDPRRRPHKGAQLRQAR